MSMLAKQTVHTAIANTEIVAPTSQTITLDDIQRLVLKMNAGQLELHRIRMTCCNIEKEIRELLSY